MQQNEYIDGMTGRTVRTSTRTPVNAWLSASDIDQIIYNAVNHDESRYDRGGFPARTTGGYPARDE